MGVSNGDEDGGGVDGDGFRGAIPRPGRVPKQRFLSPELGLTMMTAAELFVDGGSGI